MNWLLLIPIYSRNYLINILEVDINKLENSRWNANNMLDKCDMIRSILEIRKEVITDELYNYGGEH